MSDASEPQPAVPWYIRHRMRALLLFACGFLLFGLTVATTVFVLTVNHLKTTEPYAIALERVINDQRVQRLLGRPLEPMWFASGQVNKQTGYTEMNLRVEGPTGHGTARARLRRDPGETEESWQIVFLDVGCFSDFGVESIEIVGDEPPTGVQLPEPTQEAKEKYGVGE